MASRLDSTSSADIPIDDTSVEELIFQAECLTWADPMSLVLAERAVQLADQERDDQLRFSTRAYLICFATSVGAIDKALVAAAWCSSHPELLAESDEDTRFQFLWNLKLILHGSFELPQIERQQMDDILAQMSRFHREYGYNQRATEYMRFVNQMNAGYFDAASADYTRFVEIPRDYMADCEACETNSRVEFLSCTSRDREALKVATPLVSGRLSCVEVPHSTYSHLLQPLIRMGKHDLADEYHKTGYAKVRSNRFLIKETSKHIGYDVYRENYARAISRFERQLPTALAAVELSEKYCFFTVAAFLMERLAARGRSRKLKLPSDFPLCDESNRYDCGHLHAWFESESGKLADAFDRRNGNDYYRNRLRAELRYESVGLSQKGV